MEKKLLELSLAAAIYFWSLDFYRSKTKYDVCIINETEDAPSDYIREKTFTDPVLAEHYAEKLRKKLGTEVIVEVREGDTMEDNYLPIFSSVCYENVNKMHVRIWF